VLRSALRDDLLAPNRWGYITNKMTMTCQKAGSRAAAGVRRTLYLCLCPSLNREYVIVAATGITGAFQLSNPVSFLIIVESTDGCNGSFVSGSTA
jgi:hypothetical protein